MTAVQVIRSKRNLTDLTRRVVGMRRRCRNCDEIIVAQRKSWGPSAIRELTRQYEHRDEHHAAGGCICAGVPDVRFGLACNACRHWVGWHTTKEGALTAWHNHRCTDPAIIVRCAVYAAVAAVRGPL